MHGSTPSNGTRHGHGGVSASPAAVADEPNPLAGIVKSLRLLGMPPREARLYYALVQSGPLVAREAAEDAGLHRATAYRVLLRLLDRGLVLGDGRSPQRFQAIPPEVLLQRLILSLRDEEEVLQLFGELYARGVSPGPPAAEDAASGTMRSRLLAPVPGGTHPALTELGGARLGVDVLVRPLALGASYRSALAKTLARLVRQGTRVRLITDATPVDHRFVMTLGREAGGESLPALSVRHYTPMLSHSYLIDGRRVIRFPSLGTLGRSPDVAIALGDFARVRGQISRFETFWSEAAASVGRPHSTRTYGWRPPNGASVGPNPPYARTAYVMPYSRPGDWTPPVPPKEFRYGTRGHV